MGYGALGGKLIILSRSGLFPVVKTIHKYSFLKLSYGSLRIACSLRFEFSPKGRLDSSPPAGLLAETGLAFAMYLAVKR